MNNIELERMLLFFFIFGILCHSLACLWFLVAKLQDFNSTTWVFRYEYYDSPLSEQYLASLYFIVTTITTVGYGDITSKNPAEQAFCIILMLIGVIAYSMAISSFTNIMSLSNRNSKILLNKLHILSRLRDYYDLSFEFYWRLRQSLHYDHEMDMSEKLNFVRELPPKLQVELSNIMYSHQLGGINYFDNKSPQFIAALAPKLKPLKVCKGDYLFLKGDPLDGIYFIKRGEAAYVERRPKADLIFATNKSGSYFGDIDFAVINEKLEPKRLFTVKAKTDMDLLLLEKEDLYSIDNHFKKQIFSLFQNSMNHLEKLKTMNRRSSQWLKKRLNIADPNYSKVTEEEEDQYSIQNIAKLSEEVCDIRSHFTPSENSKFTNDTLGSFFSTQNQGGGNVLSKELQLRQRSFFMKRNKKKNTRLARIANKYSTSSHFGSELGNFPESFRTESALQDQEPLRKSRFQKLDRNNYLSDNGDYGGEKLDLESKESDASSDKMSQDQKSFTSDLMMEELQ